jgi:hypothetical protein
MTTRVLWDAPSALVELGSGQRDDARLGAELRGSAP